MPLLLRDNLNLHLLPGIPLQQGLDLTVTDAIDH
jgi:hypothetical protein